MSRWVSYLSLALLPLLVVFPFNLVAFSWGFRHGTEQMPPELALRSGRIDTYVPWMRDILLLVIVLSLATHYAVPFAQIGLRWHGWPWNLAIGIGASVLQIGIQWFFWRLLTTRRRYPEDKRLLIGSGAGWATSNLVSVFAQEIWIAFCTLTLKQSGRSTLVSLVLIGIVFGAAHYQYKLGALATALYGVLFASLFLWRASLLPSLLVHYVGNVGAFYFARSGRPAHPNSTLAGRAPATQCNEKI